MSQKKFDGRLGRRDYNVTRKPFLALIFASSALTIHPLSESDSARSMY